jgi:hypothetical protein
MAIGFLATNNQTKMKRYLRRFTFTIGVLIAIVVLVNTRSFADKKDRDDLKVLLSIDTETLSGIEFALKGDESNATTEKRIKIFNSARQLIYESRDKADKKLTLLLRRSDLVLQTESSSYYLLGD